MKYNPYTLAISIAILTAITGTVLFKTLSYMVDNYQGVLTSVFSLCAFIGIASYIYNSRLEKSALKKLEKLNKED